MEILLRSAMPPFAARYELEFHYALGAKIDGDGSIGRLHRHGHVNAGAFPESGENVGPVDNLRKVRRSDLLLAFGHEYEIDGQLAPGPAERVQGGKPHGFRAALIDRAAADQNLAKTRLVDDPRFEGRGSPFGWICLLHVVHEVDADGFRRAGIERGEDSGVAIGGNFLHLAEAGVLQHAHHETAACIHAAVFGGNGGLANPVLKPLDSLVVALGDSASTGFRSASSRARARLAEISAAAAAVLCMKRRRLRIIVY